MTAAKILTYSDPDALPITGHHTGSARTMDGGGLPTHRRGALRFGSLHGTAWKLASETRDPRAACEASPDVAHETIRPTAA